MVEEAVRRGDIWLADYGEPVGSEPGFRRPVVIVQSDKINASRFGSYLAVPMTTNLNWALAASNLLLPAQSTGLRRDSVAQTALLTATDHSRLLARLGKVDDRLLDQLFHRIDLALGRR
jgi:mRNA interferase MazF